MKEKYTAIMVSETHWDRAWYNPFQEFRVRLVRLIDRAIEILRRDPDFHSFMLDGQMIPLEDYLEVRPEKEQTLQELVQAGRLLIGPWYVLADEYLVSPESLIRNLMWGMKMAEILGKAMKEGYVPDAFGHISQLPQILRGFGIESAIFWRGVGDEGEKLGAEFWWRAPDGSQVLTIFLVDGYHNAANLGFPMRWGDPSAMEFNMDLALRKLRKAVDTLKPYAHTPFLLLMNGIDHAEPQPEVPRIIQQADRTFEDVEIVHGDLPDYIRRVREASPELPTFEGEFNRGRYAPILQGVYSTRIYIKQANESVSTLLERYAEPISTWAWLLGEDYPNSFLWTAWRWLMKNHPHDDICGCSDDQVHRENMYRFAQAEQIGRVLVRDGMRRISRHIDRSAQPGLPVLLFNPLAWERSEVVEATIPFDLDDPTAENFSLVNPRGEVVSGLQVLGREDVVRLEVLKGSRKKGVRVAFPAWKVPPCGYRVYYAVPAMEAPAPDGELRLLSHGPGMENDFLQVKINEDGTLNILDKETGKRFEGVHYFEDTEDAGDEYDYSPCHESQTLTSQGQGAKVRLLHDGPAQITYEVRTVLRLPVGLTADRKRRSKILRKSPIISQVTLRRGSRLIEIVTRLDNRVRDHRLRACFPTGLQAQQSHADGHFAVISRQIAMPHVSGWAHAPTPTRHQRYFVDLNDGKCGLAILNRGLPEYEVIPLRNVIALTLLRGVGWLSRPDLLTRPGDVGPSWETPEAQCLGQHRFEYAILPHAGGWEGVYREAYNYSAPMHIVRGDEHEGFDPEEIELEKMEGPVTMKHIPRTGELPGELSFLSIQPEALVLSAVKRSERSDCLIVRFYNIKAEPLTAKVRLFRQVAEAFRVNLNEERIEPLKIEPDGAVSLAVRGNEVVTLEIR